MSDVSDPAVTRRDALAAGGATTVLGFGFWTEAFAADGAGAGGTVLITGASRGIGFEFAKQYAQAGWTVIATARNPATAEPLKALAKAHKNIRIEALDVTDVKAVDALAEKLKGTAIDVLINNAGISGGAQNQKVGTIKYEVFDDVMRTNVMGPIKIAEAFTPHVAASTQKKIVSISSTEGSLTGISGRPDVNSIFYRASKSALNMAMINMAKALKDKGIIVVMLSPGLVQTDFVGDLRLPIMISPEQSVAMTMPIIARVTMADTGKYFRHTGELAAW
ncbi:MAG: SDR family oxidoreductase [Rhodospirillaceae bacterium]|nr:SDR family oxidoreductase [Rhodospirillaceae bacterium]